MDPMNTITPLKLKRLLEANPALRLLDVRTPDEFAEVLPLIAARRRVIALDTPGYGCSDPVSGQPTVADYAGVVRALRRPRASIDTRGLDPVDPTPEEPLVAPVQRHTAP